MAELEIPRELNSLEDLRFHLLVREAFQHGNREAIGEIFEKFGKVVTEIFEVKCRRRGLRNVSASSVWGTTVRQLLRSADQRPSHKQSPTFANPEKLIHYLTTIAWRRAMKKHQKERQHAKKQKQVHVAPKEATIHAPAPGEADPEIVRIFKQLLATASPYDRALLRIRARPSTFEQMACDPELLAFKSPLTLATVRRDFLKACTRLLNRFQLATGRDITSEEFDALKQGLDLDLKDNEERGKP